MQSVGRAFSSGSFQADDAIDFFLLREERGNRIFGDARVSFVVDRLNNLDARDISSTRR